MLDKSSAVNFFALREFRFGKYSPKLRCNSRKQIRTCAPKNQGIPVHAGGGLKENLDKKNRRIGER
jgi:hypothetical protein